MIEILLVIAIILTVGFFSGIFPLQMISQTAVNDASNVIKTVLWKAETYALAGREHSAWGVHYNNSAVILFKGGDYGNRDASFDEDTKINERIQVSNFSDIVFGIPDGKPLQEVQNITFSWNGSEKTISVNKEGVIK